MAWQANAKLGLNSDESINAIDYAKIVTSLKYINKVSCVRYKFNNNVILAKRRGQILSQKPGKDGIRP